MFALVDCNNFYVSCERVFNPGLNGQPVVVLSNNDGCIISRSDEAKALGLKMAEPAFYRKEFLDKNKVRCFSSNYALYGDMSQRVMETLREFSPCVEVYSIDECFLGLLELPCTDLYELAKKIRRTVLRNTGIPVSVGIAATKTLSKIANHMAKKDRNGRGIMILSDPEQTATVLKNTPSADIWGIGRQYARLLENNKIRTAWDLTCMNDTWIRSHMSIVGVRLKNELLGKSCLALEMVQPPKKAIATTRAFGKKITDYEFIREAVATYATRCAEKLRRQNSVASVVNVFIHTDPFNQQEKYFHASASFSLPVPTNHHHEIVRYALKTLKKIFVKDYRYKKAGVIVMGIQPDNIVQSNLFDKLDRKRQKNLGSMVDRLNRKYGRDTLRLAVQGNGREWKLKQEKLSGQFTTKWNEIINVKS